MWPSTTGERRSTLFLPRHTRPILLGKRPFPPFLDTNEDGDDYDINYEFNLGPPTIQFVDTRTTPVCDLTIDIVGGKAWTKKKSLDITSGVYTLHLDNFELATANGGNDSTNYTDAATPFVFPADNPTDGVVVIDLPSSKSLAVTIDTNTTSNTVVFIEKHKSQIGDRLKAKLRTDYSSVRLELARVASSPPPSADCVQLQPRSFMFTTYNPPSSSGSEVLLSLLIQTRDGNNPGVREDLADAWNNRWRHDLGCSPVSSGHTASIIFNKQMIHDSMIKPTLKDQTFDSTLVDTEGSLEISVSTGKKVHRDRYYKHRDNMEEWTVSEINVTLPDLHLQLHETPEHKAECYGRWSYQYSFDWSHYIAGEYPVNEYGSVTVTNDLNKALSIFTIADDDTIDVQCSISKADWTVEMTPDDPSFWDAFTGKRKVVPDWVKDLCPELPGFNINLGKLYFFRTTNLLMPTQKIISIDRGVGLHVPQDFYLIGQLVGA
ncbi:hypothetical protein B0T26DRAFT_506872 [Lasiosphaeria miniovina]|uniref:Uncharacterized protein n=1 Tax=Lasiosphaeria miniovina TaxID=1954250 RepID=A0AA39ZU69_9PEZI|nr:uncharacterized protein B0T26DRAFT_506872 [Lasiosphaeria miniovina]KAK0703599.1 hypothetical protein B0T26DRAFT_506872 [Lasiosphaeria miniovina]